MSATDGAAAMVVKVGGSLYDLPDLGARLRGWLRGLDTHRLLLVPGGGPAAEMVRALDCRHGLGEETAHWLALRALAMNAHFLKALLPEAVLVADWAACPALWQRRLVPILDAHAFAVADDDEPGALPHCWQVSSDSVAARAAVVGGVKRLILLKSVDVPDDIGWPEAAERGLVDAWFARTIEPGVRVRAVNLRTWPGERSP